MGKIAVPAIVDAVAAVEVEILACPGETVEAFDRGAEPVRIDAALPRQPFDGVIAAEIAAVDQLLGRAARQTWPPRIFVAFPAVDRKRTRLNSGHSVATRM